MPKRILQGTVVSDKNDKTVVVKVERRFIHPLFKKVVRRSKNYQAHDEGNSFKVGDQVFIEECKPISKTKRWTVIEAQAPQNKCWQALSRGKVGPVIEEEAVSQS